MYTSLQFVALFLVIHSALKSSEKCLECRQFDTIYLAQVLNTISASSGNQQTVLILEIVSSMNHSFAEFEPWWYVTKQCSNWYGRTRCSELFHSSHSASNRWEMLGQKKQISLKIFPTNQRIAEEKSNTLVCFLSVVLVLMIFTQIFWLFVLSLFISMHIYVPMFCSSFCCECCCNPSGITNFGYKVTDDGNNNKWWEMILAKFSEFNLHSTTKLTLRSIKMLSYLFPN